MKKNQFPLLMVFIVFCFTSQAKPKDGWKPLFGADFSQSKYDKSCWKVENGVLTASEDKMIWAVGDYENFALDLEFKTASGTNSGVVVYCTDPENWIPSSVEIQIADDYSDKWGKASKDWQCGAIFGHLAANEQKVVKKPGEWNKMAVTCKGKIIQVELNGKKITTMDMSRWTSGKLNPDGSEIPAWLPKPFAELPTKGMIGLQGKHADATIWFRNVKIKQL